MNFLVKLFRSLWYLLWYLFAACVVLTAAIFGLVRLLLPLVDDYNKDVEQYASDLVGRPIKIMSLDAEWHGFSPSLVLNNVRLLSIDGTDTILQLSRARLDFDLLAMASTRQVQFRRFALSGADISLVRQKSGLVNLSGFESSQIETGGDEDTTAILHWLLTQGEISLHARNLVYQDNKSNRKRFHFSNVSFVLKNQAGRHLIDGAIGFSKKNNQEFAFALDLTGDITSGNNWSGKIYVNGTNLDITRIFGVLGSNGHRVNIGNSNFELWTDWRNAELISLQGDLSLEKVHWQSVKRFTPLLQPLLQGNTSIPENSITIDRDRTRVTEYRNIIGRFMWDKYDEGWQLIADNFVMARGSRIWPSTQFAVHYIKDKSASHQLNFRSNMVRTEDLAPLVPILFGSYKNYTSLVERLAPEGDIRNVNFRWSEADNNFDMAARLDNVGFSAIDKLPGITGLTGELRSTRQGGSLSLNTFEAGFSLPDMFRWDIPIKRLRGQVDWSIDDDEITVSSKNMELATAHVQSKAVIDLQIPRGKGAPFLSLITKFEKGDGSKASFYYPVSKLKENTVKWLDGAIIQGDIVSGGAIVYGQLDQFPFTKGQGVFETRFDVENGILDYAENWPKIHSLNANVLFKGDSLLITSESGKIFDSSLSDVRVSIPALGKRPLDLTIEGKVFGESQEKLNYLMISPPLNKKYGQYLTGLKASGESELYIKIGMQIKPKVESQVTGKLLLMDNGLELKEFPSLLTNINVIDAKQLSAEQFPVLEDLVDGKSTWNLQLRIPADDQPKSKRNIQIKAASNLNGTEVKLPSPFTKSQSDVRQFRLLMNIKNSDKALIKADYGGSFEGIFECDFDRPYWVTRGEMRFGGGPVVLPRSGGLRIVGHMKELSVDIWRNLFKQMSAQLSSIRAAVDAKPKESDLLPMHLAIVNSGRFVAYDNKKLGSVAIETSKTEKGMLLQQLIMNPRETTIKGHGHWLIEKGVHQSLLDFELESKDLGKTMKDLGYVETIEEGEGKITAKLRWPSTIFDPDFSHLSGEVELDFKNGRILDIEPGRAARLFGLFSIQTLPRRLTLDFSDMFAKGLSFDFVTGNFQLENGDAYTNNFKLLGTNADIALKGRIGLAAQDYDQKVRVTPHITDAAVLLSILTAQPLIILFQQILKADIEGAASIEYALTGPGNNSTLTPVLQQPLFDDEVDEF
ncbi:MAG: AsmA-like C-terminal region-containing protein [Gammaproteobacteria bacterium]